MRSFSENFDKRRIKKREKREEPSKEEEHSKEINISSLCIVKRDPKSAQNNRNLESQFLPPKVTPEEFPDFWIGRNPIRADAPLHSRISKTRNLARIIFRRNSSLSKVVQNKDQNLDTQNRDSGETEESSPLRNTRKSFYITGRRAATYGRTPRTGETENSILIKDENKVFNDLKETQPEPQDNVKPVVFPKSKFLPVAQIPPKRLQKFIPTLKPTAFFLGLPLVVILLQRWFNFLGGEEKYS